MVNIVYPARAYVALNADVEDSKIKIQHKIEENVRLSLDLKHLSETSNKV
jgi:regulator of replication initiation timing